MKPGFVFIIEFLGQVPSSTTCFVVEGDLTFDQATEKVHPLVKREYPDGFTDDWRDLRDDIENGEQTCYGPMPIQSV